MTNRKAKPKPEAKGKKTPVAAPPRPLGYSYERVALSMGLTEKPARLKRIPGMRDAKWDRTIGRHVVGKVKSDFQRQVEMDARLISG